MRECPDCRGKRVPCARCHGKRIVEGEPRDGAEAGRVRVVESIQRAGLRATYEALRDRKPLP